MQIQTYILYTCYSSQLTVIVLDGDLDTVTSKLTIYTICVSPVIFWKLVINDGDIDYGQRLIWLEGEAGR